jgi:hypothetical protein
VILLGFIQIDKDKKWTLDRANYRTLLFFDAVDTDENPESIASYMQNLKEEEISEYMEMPDMSHLNSSVFSRIWHVRYVFSVVTENGMNFMLGKGFGSYAFFCCDVDKLDHPHNILLEIWFELGIIGLIVFLSFLTLVVVRSFSNEFNLFPIIICSLFLFLNALKSSSIVEIRDFFSFTAMVAFMNKYK